MSTKDRELLELAAAHEMAKAGIMFIPMPVAAEDDRNSRVIEANNRLEQMVQAAEPATEKEE